MKSIFTYQDFSIGMKSLALLVAVVDFDVGGWVEGSVGMVGSGVVISEGKGFQPMSLHLSQLQ